MRRIIADIVTAAVFAAGTVPAGDCPKAIENRFSQLAPQSGFNGSTEPAINKRRVVALLIEAGVPPTNAGKITEEEARQVLKIISGDESNSQKVNKVLAILSKRSIGRKQVVDLVRFSRDGIPDAETSVSHTEDRAAHIKEKLASPPNSQAETIAQIRQSLERKKVVVVLGRPQIGKSSHLKSLGLYFNLEKFGMYEFATGDNSLSGLNGLIELLAHQLNIPLSESPENFVEQVKARVKDKIVIIDEFQVLNRNLSTAMSWLRDGGAKVVLIGPPSLEVDSMHSSFIADLKRRGSFFIFPLPTFEEYRTVTNGIVHSALGPYVRISQEGMRKLHEVSGATYVMTKIIIDHLRKKHRSPEAEIGDQVNNLNLGEVIDEVLSARKEVSRHYPGREEFFIRTMYGLDTSGVMCHPKNEAIRKRMLYSLIDPVPITALDGYSDMEFALFELLFNYGFIEYNPADQTIMVRGALLRECARRFYGASEPPARPIEFKFQMEQLPQAEGRRNFEEMQRLERSGELDRLKPKKTRERKKISELAVEDAGEMEVKDGNVGIARAGGSVRYLDSGGIGPCIVVTLYDKKTRTGAMLHFLTQVFDAADNLNRTFAYLREWGVDTKNLEARIIGGDNQSDNSKYLFYKIHRFLCDTLGEEKIVEIDVLSERLEVAFLDLTDGELYDSDMPEVLRQMDAIRALSGVAPQPEGTSSQRSKPKSVVPDKEMVFDMISGKVPSDVKEAVWQKVRAHEGGFASEAELEGFVRRAFNNRRAIAGGA